VSCTITGVRDADVCTGNRLCVLRESGINNDVDEPVINESVMKMHACTPSQDTLIALSNRTGIYPSKSVIAVETSFDTGSSC
jgi:hypothetical protein